MQCAGCAKAVGVIEMHLQRLEHMDAPILEVFE